MHRPRAGTADRSPNAECVSRVIYVKRGEAQDLRIIDAGMNDLNRRQDGKPITRSAAVGNPRSVPPRPRTMWWERWGETSDPLLPQTAAAEN